MLASSWTPYHLLLCWRIDSLCVVWQIQIQILSQVITPVPPPCNALFYTYTQLKGKIYNVWCNECTAIREAMWWHNKYKCTAPQWSRMWGVGHFWAKFFFAFFLFLGTPYICKGWGKTFRVFQVTFKVLEIGHFWGSWGHFSVYIWIWHKISRTPFDTSALPLSKLF